MVSHKKRAYDIMKEADIILQVIDARFPEETINKAIEKFASENGKKTALIANKEDLVSAKGKQRVKKLAGNIKLLFVSAKKKEGIASLRRLIFSMSKEGEKTKVCFVGYPNTGKSSIINALAGRHSARTSPMSGFTRGSQYISLGKKVLLIDSPGVIGYEGLPEEKLALINAKSVEHIDDAEAAALYILAHIISEKPEAVKEFYGVEADMPENMLEKIAKKKGFLVKGGEADLNRAAKVVIADWQRGKISLQ